MASLVASESSGGFSDSGGTYTVYSLVERVKINVSVRTFERIFSSIACGVKRKTGKKKNEATHINVLRIFFIVVFDWNL